MDVTALGDAAETLLAAGGVLSRCESEPGGELAPVVAQLRIAHAGRDRVGGHAGRLAHTSGGRIFGLLNGSQPITVRDAKIKCVELIAHVLDQETNRGRLCGVELMLGEPAPQSGRSGLDHHAALGEYAADASQERRALLDPAQP